MARGYQTLDDDGEPRPKPLGIWVWMAGLLAVLFFAVWMLSGEVQPSLL